VFKPNLEQLPMILRELIAESSGVRENPLPVPLTTDADTVT
jgi:hypothetical protein